MARNWDGLWARKSGREARRQDNENGYWGDWKSHAPESCHQINAGLIGPFPQNAQMLPLNLRHNSFQLARHIQVLDAELDTTAGTNDLALLCFPAGDMVADHSEQFGIRQVESCELDGDRRTGGQKGRWPRIFEGQAVDPDVY